jgi:DnaK suppressor protein
MRYGPRGPVRLESNSHRQFRTRGRGASGKNNERKLEETTHMARIAAVGTKQHQDRNYDQFGETLREQRQQLAARIRLRLGDVITERMPDDEGAVAIESYTKDLTAAQIERERQTLRQVEAALARLESGNYGVCDLCSVSIPKARLEALPWAHLCVNCAERSAAA